MKISNCLLTDIEEVLNLHDAARELQTQKRMVVWPVFDRSLIEKDLVENRLWKLTIDGKLACTWSITFDDKEIWGKRHKNDSIYLHRIATNPSMRGRRFIDIIVKWAREYASSLGKDYVRLDTLGYNEGLINHYMSAGFTYLGITHVTDLSKMPEHYHREPDCLLFEMPVYSS